MNRIKMLKDATAQDGTPLEKGAVYDVAATDLRRLVASGAAQAVPRTKAIAGPPEDKGVKASGRRSTDNE